MFTHAAYFNKAAVQKFLTQHIQFLRIPGAGVCFNYNYPCRLQSGPGSGIGTLRTW